MQFIVGVARSWPSIGFSVDLGILVSSYSINSIANLHSIDPILMF